MLYKGPYDSKKTEPEILKFWTENGFYSPEYREKKGDKTKRETFTIILPPPNANGNLHLGHMSGYAYQDLMGRYNRMKGKKVLLLPGKDHAGIQTEVVFEKELEKKGKTKQMLGRETFYKACYEFCMKMSKNARSQEQALGLSADYDREMFTLDEKIVDTVLESFIQLYEDGLIYRDKRLINWCVKDQSALADIDTEFKDSETAFVYFKYGFTEPEPFALEIKNKFAGKEVEWTFERMKAKTKDLDFPSPYGEIIEDFKNPNDGDKLDVIGIGYDKKLKPGDKLKGKAIGIMMRLDKNYNLIVQNPDFDGDIKKEIDENFLTWTKLKAGVHIILFEKYPDDKFYTNGFIIGTVRPETKFGDTALAVSPEDERYAEFVGKEFEVLTLKGPAKMKVIADKAVEKDFGTGALKITPAHAQEDWDIASRHPETLPEKQVINFDGKLNHLTGKYEGMTVKEARKAMIPDMEELGMLVHLDESYKNRIRICERCKHQIEPLVSYQWFLNTNPFKEKAAKLVEAGFTDILPEGKKKVYLNWMKSPEAWCLTRQLWWGYRVPVFYKEEPKEYITETGEVKEKIGDKIIEKPEDYKGLMSVSKSGEAGWHQDEDVLDTWFSSGQWPYATLAAKEGDTKEFYPTQVMETGWDILIFWVTRMMLLNPYKAEKNLGKKKEEEQVPFKDVYLHGLVLDKNGVKMSKSKGNGIDPFEMMQLYGTDALRFSFISGNSPGQNYRLYPEKIAGFRNFINKIWNASKFALMNLENFDPNEKVEITEADDKEMLKTIKELTANTTRQLDKFFFGIAATELYDSFWHTFADVYIEKAKARLWTKDKEGNPINQDGEGLNKRRQAQYTLWYCLKTYLQLLHPMIPFVTEEIWKELPKDKNEKSETIMYSQWPKE